MKEHTAIIHNFQREIGGLAAEIIKEIIVSVEMSQAAFFEKMNEYFPYNYETLIRNLHKMSKKRLSNEEISYGLPLYLLGDEKFVSAMRKVCEFRITDSNLSDEDRKRIEQQYTKVVLPMLNFFNVGPAKACAVFEFFVSLQDIGLREYNIVNGFMRGIWPEKVSNAEAKGLTAEEAEVLRQALRYYPPKCWNKPFSISKNDRAAKLLNNEWFIKKPSEDDS